MDQLTGVILAGGKSQRFGTNKAFAAWGDRTLIERVIETFGSLFAHILVLVKKKPEFVFLENSHVHIHQDLFEDVHPLGGIYSGLIYAQTSHIFVGACDMPFMKPSLVKLLWEKSSGYAAVIPRAGGKLQPLCGIYSKRCLEPMRLMVRANKLRLQEIDQMVPVHIIPEEELRVVDPTLTSFWDIDTRLDYQRAKEESYA